MAQQSLSLWAEVDYPKGFYCSQGRRAWADLGHSSIGLVIVDTVFTDQVERFLIDTAGVRGEFMRMGEAWQQLVAHGDYPQVVKRLLGEAVASAVLLADIIKIDGRLTLQIKGEGALQLLVVQVSANGQVRGTAKWGDALDTEVPALQQISGAQMLVAVSSEKNAEEYQGIVDLRGCDSLHQALENYFQHSEQLPSKLWLCADNDQISGLMLQKLPAQEQCTEESWSRVTQLANTVTDEEMAKLDAETLLYRLFHEETVQVFPSKSLLFQCNCSQDRTEKMVLGLGLDDALSLVQEQGVVEVKCEFCYREYRFEESDIRKLFNQPGVMSGNQTRH